MYTYILILHASAKSGTNPTHNVLNGQIRAAHPTTVAGCGCCSASVSIRSQFSDVENVYAGLGTGKDSSSLDIGTLFTCSPVTWLLKRGDHSQLLLINNRQNQHLANFLKFTHFKKRCNYALTYTCIKLEEYN